MYGVRSTVYLSAPSTLVIATWLPLEFAMSALICARRDRGDAVKRLAVRRAVAAGEDAPVVAEDAVVAGAAGDPVVAVAADDRVVLAFAEQHVVALAAVDEVVALLAVDFVGGTDVARRRGRVEVGPARRVVEQLHRPHDDLQRRVVGRRRRN